MESMTLWERSGEVASGMRAAVRAATFSVGDETRSAVTVTVVVPADFFTAADGGVAATVLLNPDEAVLVADWLREAFATAEAAAPPMYG